MLRNSTNAWRLWLLSSQQITQPLLHRYTPSNDIRERHLTPNESISEPVGHVLDGKDSASTRGFHACIMWKNDKSIRKTRLSYTRSAFRTMAPSEGKSDQMLTLFQSVFVPRNVISKLSLAINNISNGDFFLACIIPVLRHVPLNDCKPRFPCWKHIFYTFMSTLEQSIAPKNAEEKYKTHNLPVGVVGRCCRVTFRQRGVISP